MNIVPTTPRSLFPALVLFLASLVVYAQNAPPGPDMTLDAAARAQVIDGALKALKENYVFPEIADKMEQAIRARQQRKEYDPVTSSRNLAQLLTDHLREVSHDKHLRVNYSPDVLPPMPPPAAGAPTSAEAQAQMERMRATRER